MRNLVGPVEFGVPGRHLSGNVKLATGERLGCTTPGLEGSPRVSYSKDRAEDQALPEGERVRSELRRRTME